MSDTSECRQLATLLARAYEEIAALKARLGDVKSDSSSMELEEAPNALQEERKKVGVLQGEVRRFKELLENKDGKCWCCVE